MRSSRGAIAAYTGAFALQAALLGAAWRIQALTTEKMMVMRYFVAKNLLLEGHVFSPAGRNAQVVTFALIVLAAVVAASRWFAQGKSAVAVRSGVAAVLAASGAGMLLFMSDETTRGLYALVFAVWLALLVQAMVVLASARSAKRSAG